MKFKIANEDLKNLSACCSRPSRKMLVNIFLTVKGGRAELAATDGGILAVTQREGSFENTPEGFKTVIPSSLHKRFKKRAILEISTTETEGLFIAKDTESGEEVSYTAPVGNIARPNYETILEERKSARTAEHYAVFSPEVLKKIENLIGFNFYENYIPRAIEKNYPHFWECCGFIIAAMPYRN